jgi:hypothetical protein
VKEGNEDSLSLNDHVAQQSASADSLRSAALAAEL